MAIGRLPRRRVGNQLGLPAAPPAVENDAKWHSGVVLGIAELSGPYDLQKACPQGWAEVKTETSFVNGVLELVTSGIYSPQSVTIRCSAVAALTPPATEGGGASPAIVPPAEQAPAR